MYNVINTISTIMLQTHGKREARSVKRFSIGIHVSLGIARETARDEEIFPILMTCKFYQ